MDDTGPPNQLQQLHSTYTRRLQQMLDRSSPHVTGRWVGLALLALLYTARVWWLRGFYIVTYAIAIYNLNLLLGFLTPQVDPETAEDGPELPTKADQEFKPFIRRLPEFKFWWSATKSFLIGFTVTFFKVFDVPVFWPILLLYWFVLFFVTMKRQIMHMIKYKYLPFSLGKKRYSGKGGEKRPLKDAKDEGPSTAPVAVTTAVAPVVGVPQSGPAPNLRQVAAGSQGGAPPHVVAGGYGVAPAAGTYGVAPAAYAPAAAPMLYQQPRPTGQPDMMPGAVPVYGSGQPANGQPSSRPPGTMLPL